jgi:predicted transposase/invertase (TIGR01784 family)
VISISIVYFDLGKGEDYIYHGTTSFKGIHNHELLALSASQKELYKTAKVENIYPEYYLIKVKNFNDVARDTLDEWVYFLKNSEVKEGFKAKGLDKAKEVLDYLKCSEDERRSYERYKESLHYQASMYETNYLGAKIEGKQEGKIEGKLEEKIEIAKNLLSMGLTIESIVIATKLTADEIEKLVVIKHDD